MPRKKQESSAKTGKSAQEKVALYWDCQNVKITPERADFLLKFASDRGVLTSKKAYSNWEYESKNHAQYLEKVGFERVNVSDSAKNSVDHKLLVDCADEVYANDSPDRFIIVSGDGDFTGLVYLLKSRKKQVIVFAQPSGVSQELIKNADESHFIESVDEIPQIPPFRNPGLLTLALTHRSYTNEHPTADKDNERLEFLGDSVLNFLSSQFLYHRYPDLSESQLTRLRSALVDEPQLADFARYLDLGKKMRLGKGTVKDKGRHNESLLSNTFEAIIGAYFLDAGMEAVRNFIQPLFSAAADSLLDTISPTKSDMLVDSKNRFQEWVQANLGSMQPQYEPIAKTGPDHAPQFTVKVTVADKEYGRGTGSSKKEAEKRAAEAALEKVSGS